RTSGAPSAQRRLPPRPCGTVNAFDDQDPAFNRTISGELCGTTDLNIESPRKCRQWSLVRVRPKIWKPVLTKPILQRSVKLRKKSRWRDNGDYTVLICDLSYRSHKFRRTRQGPLPRSSDHCARSIKSRIAADQKTRFKRSPSLSRTTGS